MGIIYFVLVLGVIVLVHEIGHLVSAKLFGVYCYEFAIGMGPKIFSIKGKETVYSLRLFPIGGYVKMAGETEEEKEIYENIEVPSHRSLVGIHHWKRIVVLVSGALMNFVLAWVLMSGVLLSVGSYALPTEPIVDEVVAGSPAALAGLLPKDEIIKVSFDDGTIIIPDTFEDFAVFTQSYKGEITFTVLRNQSETLEMTMQGQLSENGRYLLGIAKSQVNYADVNIGNCLFYGADYLKTTAETMIQSLARLLQGRGLDQMSGPVGIYEATAKQVEYGFLNVLAWIAMLSLNIGIFNLLPLPALDGGRIILVAISWITGKPINQKIETGLIAGSMLLLLALMLLVTWQDIMRLF